MYTSGEFILHRGDTPFANRQKLLFDELLHAERGCKRNRAIDASKDMDLEVDEIPKQPTVMHRRPKLETKKFRGKESIFKRPNGPAPRASMKNIPDHHRNPHKWVKYSLGDVSNEDMTEQSNTNAALSFLKEIRARRLQEQERKTEDKMDIEGPSCSEQNKTNVPFKQRNYKANSEVQFRKPKIDADTEEPVAIDYDNRPMFRSSKIIMPEYVIGQKQKKKIKKDKQPTGKAICSKELKLDHLQEYDDDDEEER